MAVPPPPSGSHFQTSWFLRLLLRSRQATVQEPFFQLQTGFLHALDRWRHPSLHSSGTHTISGHRLRDWTSDLSSCQLTPELRGEPCREKATPLVDGQNSWVYSSTLVQSLYISCYVFSNKLVLSYLLLCLLPH